MGSFYDLLLASKLSGGGGGGGAVTGDKWLEKLITVEKMEIFAEFVPEQSLFGGNCGATEICLWNATGATGGYTAQNMINYCKNVVTIVLPKMTRCSQGLIGNNANLETIDLGKAATIDANAFANNAKLVKVIIRSSSVPSLGNTNVFNNTPFKSGGTGGTLYVPQSLISSYQGASNWSTIIGYTNNQIKSIESSIYKNAYADGTPISA